MVEVLTITREIVKNYVMHSELVRRHRGSRSAAPDLAKGIEAARRTAQFYQTHLRRLGYAEPRFDGKRVLEVGPGSHLGIPLWFLAHGAAFAAAVDRYPDLMRPPGLAEFHQRWIQDWPAEAREHVASLAQQPAPAFQTRTGPLHYCAPLCIEHAAEALPGKFDIVLSFNVLGYVTDVDATFHALYALMGPGAVMVHRIHHGTHGRVDGVRAGWLHQYTYSRRVWRMMYSNRGGPNREPASAYLKACRAAGFADAALDAVQRLPDEVVEQNRALVHPSFAGWSHDDFAVHSSVLVARRP